MLEYHFLLLSLMRATMRDRQALVAENLLLRHQLAVLTRPTRKRPRPGARDKLFWVLVRALRGDWRQHLRVTPRPLMPATLETRPSCGHRGPSAQKCRDAD